MKKPLTVSSPTHAIALAVYFVLGLFGFAGVFGLSKQSTIVQAMGEGTADIWATTLMIGGWGALASAIAASKARRPEYNLRLEKIFCIDLFINLSYFVYISIQTYGLERAFSTTAFSVTFAVGFFFRVIQLWRDRRLIIRARLNPEPADPVMADPRDEDR